MLAFVSSGARDNARIDMPLEEFLRSGHMVGRARAAMCSPEQLVVDYLPDFDAGDANEVREAFSEACYQAADGGIDKIKFDRHDLRFIRNRFVRRPQFRLFTQWPQEAA